MIPFAVLLLLLTSSIVYGDRGMIPLVPEVSVYELGKRLSVPLDLVILCMTQPAGLLRF